MGKHASNRYFSPRRENKGIYITTAMKSFTHSSIIIALLVFSIMFTGCGKDSGGSGGIELDLIEATTELPAKVRLFFRVDLGEVQFFRALEESDFEIYENSSLISTLESQAKVQNETGSFLFSSILLLDLSGSVLNSADLTRIKDAAENYIDSVMPNEVSEEFGSKELAIYWFDGEENIHELAGFTVDAQALIDSIRTIDTDISNDNSTNLNGAVVQGLAELESRISEINQDPNVSSAGMMLVFTDGTDQAGRVTSDAAISTVQLLSNQFSVFSVGLGDAVDESVLNRIGRDGYFQAGTSFDLNQIFLESARSSNELADSYIVLEYCSPKRSGDHNIELRATFDDKVGRLTTQFNANGFTGGCQIR